MLLLLRRGHGHAVLEPGRGHGAGALSTSALAAPPLTRPSFEARRGELPLGAIFGGASLLACAAVGLLGLDRLGVTLCVFRWTTGLPCPTCGATRAVGRLAHLDLAGAFVMNPLAAAVTLLLLAWGLVDLLLLPSRRALRLAVPRPWQGWLRALAVLAFLLNWAFLLAVRR